MANLNLSYDVPPEHLALGGPHPPAGGGTVPGTFGPGMSSGRGSSANPIVGPETTVEGQQPVTTVTTTPIIGERAAPEGEANSYTPKQRAGAIAMAQRSAPGGRLGGPIERDSRINEGYKSIPGGTPDSEDRQGHSGITGKDYDLNSDANTAAANGDVNSTLRDDLAKGRISSSGSARK